MKLQGRFLVYFSAIAFFLTALLPVVQAQSVVRVSQWSFPDRKGTPVAVEPASLYLSQLSERLGEEAAKNIGY